MSRAKAPSLLGIINAMSGIDVDRNVVVHLRARQADIYEKALRKIANDAYFNGSHLHAALQMYGIAQAALKRAGRVK